MALILTLSPRRRTIVRDQVMPFELELKDDGTSKRKKDDATYVVSIFARGRGVLMAPEVPGDDGEIFDVVVPWERDDATLKVQLLLLEIGVGQRRVFFWSSKDLLFDEYKITAQVLGTPDQGWVAKVASSFPVNVDPGLPPRQRSVITVAKSITEPVSVSMRRSELETTSDQALWTAIRYSARRLSFDTYRGFMERVFCSEDGEPKREGDKYQRVSRRLKLPFPDTDAYRQLKVATEVFMTTHCGVRLDPDAGWLDKVILSEERQRYNQPNLSEGDIRGLLRSLLASVGPDEDDEIVRTVPYLALIRWKLGDVALTSRRPAEPGHDEAAVCMEILARKLERPCFVELIWSYWHEEGMLAQTMRAISYRFQNRLVPGGNDPLRMFEIDPLRPLGNFLWGYIQDEQHRLTVPRRAYEYDHHYGLTLIGKAVPQTRGADSRVRFLEAFHHLLQLCAIFYKEDDDTTVKADGFAVLNALKEVHLLLTQGAHNQYGDLPWTARQEMLMEQWLLARPEMREFLPSRIMVDYPEPWMDRVETMKSLQGWTDTSVMHFRDLGRFGEQVLLGIRFSDWPNVIEPERAANWARYWRPEVQGYIHGYRAVTGVDLTEKVDTTLPGLLIQRRLAAQRGAGRRVA